MSEDNISPKDYAQLQAEMSILELIRQTGWMFNEINQGRNTFKGDPSYNRLLSSYYEALVNLEEIVNVSDDDYKLSKDSKEVIIQIKNFINRVKKDSSIYNIGKRKDNVRGYFRKKIYT